MKYSVAEFDKLVSVVQEIDSIKNEIVDINKQLATINTYIKGKNRRVWRSTSPDQGIFVKHDEEQPVVIECQDADTKDAVDAAKALIEEVFKDEDKHEPNYSEFINSVFSLEAVLKCIKRDKSQQKRKGKCLDMKNIDWDAFNYKFVLSLIYLMTNKEEGCYNTLFRGNRFVTDEFWKRLSYSANRASEYCSLKIDEFEQIRKLFD